MRIQCNGQPPEDVTGQEMLAGFNSTKFAPIEHGPSGKTRATEKASEERASVQKIPVAAVVFLRQGGAIPWLTD